MDISHFHESQGDAFVVALMARGLKVTLKLRIARRVADLAALKPRQFAKRRWELCEPAIPFRQVHRCFKYAPTFAPQTPNNEEARERRPYPQARQDISLGNCPRNHRAEVVDVWCNPVVPRVFVRATPHSPRPLGELQEVFRALSPDGLSLAACFQPLYGVLANRLKQPITIACGFLLDERLINEVGEHPHGVIGGDSSAGADSFERFVVKAPNEHRKPSEERPLVIR